MTCLSCEDSLEQKPPKSTTTKKKTAEKRRKPIANAASTGAHSISDSDDDIPLLKVAKIDDDVSRDSNICEPMRIGVETAECISISDGEDEELPRLHLTSQSRCGDESRFNENTLPDRAFSHR